MYQISLQRFIRCLATAAYRGLASATNKKTNSLGKNSRNSTEILKRTMEREWTLRKANSIPLEYRLLSYNILAQELLTDNMFLYYDIDNRFLRWQYRIDLMGQEVRKLEPDIMCLQEVQHGNLKEIIHLFGLRPNGQLKLEYVFKKRTGNRCDGCVIMYDKNKFKLIAERNVEYYTDENAISNRENIALMVKLEAREDPRIRFVTATTHLLYNPRRQDVRICQIEKLLAALIEFSKEDSAEDGHRCPVILTGDFNCTTDSTAFGILTAERRKSSQKSNKEVECFQMEPIKFGTDCASTLQQNQWIIVDYILKSCSQKNGKSIQINSTYNLPKLDKCRAYGKLPNRFNGSDHFSLAIQFSIV